MDPLHSLPRQLDRLAAAADRAASRRVEAAEAVPDTQNLVGGHAVVGEGEDDVLDDVVEAFKMGKKEERKGKKGNVSLLLKEREKTRFSNIKKNKLTGTEPPAGNDRRRRRRRVRVNRLPGPRARGVGGQGDADLSRRRRRKRK